MKEQIRGKEHKQIRLPQSSDRVAGLTVSYREARSDRNWPRHDTVGGCSVLLHTCHRYGAAADHGKVSDGHMGDRLCRTDLIGRAKLISKATGGSRAVLLFDGTAFCSSQTKTVVIYYESIELLKSWTVGYPRACLGFRRGLRRIIG